MYCCKCNSEMKPVMLCGDVSGMPIYLHSKKKELFETEKRSSIECYVCPKCGYVELKAVNPKVF